MKLKTFINAFIFLLLTGAQMKLLGQADCTFKNPFLTIDFGADKEIADLNYFPLIKYQRAFTTCPEDGFYSYSSSTSDCFNGDWLTFNEDHTPGDKNGRMLLVNASETGGIFFNFMIHGLKENTTYQLGSWFINVCRIGGGCSPLPPDITIKLVTLEAKELAVFHTGLLAQNAMPYWKKYEGTFTTPPGVTTLVLTMEDVTLGGCGNDFAMDDITIQECIKPAPPIKEEPKKEEPKPVVKSEEKKVPPVSKPVTQKLPVTKPDKKDIPEIITKNPALDKPDNIPLTIKERPAITLPLPIRTRENPVIKQIETATGEIVIDLYDNGEIDGDTVSIYHNNELIVSRAGLSEKAISFHIKVDKAHPHHELVMVANNLGSIPPNTSLMIVTTTNKRYEIFISSSEQKNAKIVIDLKE